ncbi:MAG: chaperone NapD [Rhodocyclaceae bacterium]|nr:chaperone NapD [Rhodocyclaceae bacterium]
MKIVSLILRVRAADIDALRTGAEAIPGVEWQARDAERGVAIVTVEDGAGYALSDSMIAVSRLPEVQSLTLAYEYTDEGLETQEA